MSCNCDSTTPKYAPYYFKTLSVQIMVCYVAAFWKIALTNLPGPDAKHNTVKIYCRPNHALCFYVKSCALTKAISFETTVYFDILSHRLHEYKCITLLCDSYLPFNIKKKRCDQSGKESNCQQSVQRECDSHKIASQS